LFASGTSLWNLLETLRLNPHIYPQIDIKYDPDNSATTPIIVHIRPHLDLLFSGRQQRLHTICIRKLRDPHPPVVIQYNNVVLSSADEVLRRVGVSRAFGPTYPGDELRYPGLWFSFEEDAITEGLGAPHAGDRMQEVKRILISQIEPDGGKVQDALDEVNENAIMTGDLARAVVKVDLLPASFLTSLIHDTGSRRCDPLLLSYSNFPSFAYQNWTNNCSRFEFGSRPSTPPPL
jgi:Uncharacterised protein family (UPF0183)